MSKLTHASVFSGIGGSEVAASMLGWENLFHCEINPFGKAVLDYWYPNAKSYGDITKTDFREWRGKVNVLTGGFPCQPFSYAGKRRGADDDRYLWPSMYRCIDEIRPDWVVAENVAGILTMVEQGEVSAMANQATLFDEADDVRGIYQLRETFTLQRICNDLEGHGYSVQPILIPACGVGAPHRRDRVFFVARRIAADTESQQSERIRPQQPETGREEQVQFGRGSGEDVAGCYRKLEPPNSYREKLERWLQERTPESGPFQGVEPFDLSILPENRWSQFPTVSPVYRGNDGLPFPLDNLTLPKTKWHDEAIRAYGNAIVPQVMYEIFLAIQEVESTLSVRNN